MSAIRSATSPNSFRNQNTNFNIHSDELSLRPRPLRIAIAPLSTSSKTMPTGSSSSTPTLSSPAPLSTQDPTLLDLNRMYTQPTTPSLATFPDTSIGDLLHLLRTKLGSLPLEAGPIAQQFLFSINRQPSNNFKAKCARVLDGYARGLRQSKKELEALIELGEEIVREEEMAKFESGNPGEGGGGLLKEDGTRTNRQIWWFVARTVLTQADQYL